ncbi:hypothetical protein [Metabacillus fastidiosus]|uniref:DUF4352 domain-containing protein n=1 Tax=Metabacillus fastidiosus TaxID=1458 RepID=A0ABU6NRG1_9BACI|nr:hypothetical protein [Metabacillus fastidiosus]
MKKYLLMGMTTLLVVGLAACGGKEEPTNAEPEKEKQEEAKPAEQKPVSNEPEKTTNGDIVFTEAGQKGNVDGETLELLKIKTINETIDIAPLKITVQDIKLFKSTNISEATKQSYVPYNDNKQISDELIYVQIQYTVENLEEKNIGWNGLSTAVTDKGQQIDVTTKDFVYTDADSDPMFLGKVKKEFADGFIVNNADISKIKFIWSHTYDGNAYEQLGKEQQVEYEF